MSEYVRKRKFDTNECLNIYSWPIHSNIRIYSSHSDPDPYPLQWQHRYVSTNISTIIKRYPYKRGTYPHQSPHMCMYIQLFVYPYRTILTWSGSHACRFLVSPPITVTWQWSSHTQFRAKNQLPMPRRRTRTRRTRRPITRRTRRIQSNANVDLEDKLRRKLVLLGWHRPLAWLRQRLIGPPLLSVWDSIVLNCSVMFFRDFVLIGFDLALVGG